MSQWDIPEVCLFCCPRTKEKFLSLLQASSTDSSMKLRAGLSVFDYVLQLLPVCTGAESFQFNLFQSKIHLEGI